MNASEDTNFMRTKKKTNTTNLNGLFLPKLFELKKTITREELMKYKKLWLASATQGVPSNESLEILEETHRSLKNYQDQEGRLTLKLYTSFISNKTRSQLLQYYKLTEKETEVLFGMNATYVLYQLLDSYKLSKKLRVITVNDIGQTLRRTLAGEQLITELEGFEKSTVSFDTHFISLFQKAGYMRDKVFLETLQAMHEVYKPDIYIIPTVTSTGHILPFKEACLIIKKLTTSLKQKTLIILDDAQGIGRIDRGIYRETKRSSLFIYGDVILGTGTKALGAIPGTGFVLIHKKQYKIAAKDDANLLPLVSLSYTLKSLPNTSLLMKRFQRKIVSFLEKLPQVQVLSPKDSVSSIVAFYLKKKPKKATVLRQILLQPIGSSSLDQFPITLPKIIATPKIDYLRISLDPRSVTEKDFKKRLEYILERIQRVIQDF